MLFVVTLSSWAGTPKPQARIGELLITAESIEETNKVERHSPPRSGYHFVQIIGTISNVGKHALCAKISGVLETTFNLESYALAKVDGQYGGWIHQMLPSEHAALDFVFDVKDGVKPLVLVVKQGKQQGCSAKERLPITNPQARIAIASIGN